MEFPSPSAAPPDRSIDLDKPVVDPARHVLTPVEVRLDPILYKLAKDQGAMTTPAKPSTAKPASTSFKARPAPDMSINAGPKMTKSAALRQGLTWEDKGTKGRPQTADGAVRAFGDVPGHKRNNLSVNIKSLAAPAVAPRATKASQLRSGGDMPPPSTTVKRDPAVVAAELKAQAEQEKIRRRASISIPASLSAPQIAPRTNRSSELRSGGGARPPPVSFRSQSALTTTTATNVPPPPVHENTADEKAARRASVFGTVKSLGAPSIQPRLNKTTMLRNPGSTSGPVTASTVGPSSSTTTTRPKLTSGPSSQSIGAKSGPSATSASAVRPTKSSLLRAKLGAKVQTR